MLKRLHLSLLLIVCFAFFASIVVGEEVGETKSYSFAVKYHANFAMINEKGEFLTEPQFSDNGVFSEGLAPVKKNGKWGYIDRDGKTVIDFQFDYALRFSCGRAVVGWNLDIHSGNDSREYSIIDKQGNILIERGKYRSIYSFYCDRAIVNDNEGYIDLNGNLVIDTKDKYKTLGHFSEGLASVKKDRFSCDKVIDASGNVLFSYDGLSEWFRVYSCGLLCAYFEDTDRYGYIDKNGKPAIVLEAGQYPTTFSEGFAVIEEREGERDDCLSAFVIDTKGNKIIQIPKADTIKPFSEGFAAYCVDEKWGFCNTQGVVFPPKWTDVTSFYNGIAWIEEGEQVKAMRTDGTFLPLKNMVCHSDSFFDDVGKFYDERYWNLCGFSEDRGFIPVNTAIISSSEPKKHLAYTSHLEYGFSDGYVCNHESSKDRPLLLDENGKGYVYGNYNSCLPFREGRAIVSVGEDKRGMVDLDGNYTEIPYCVDSNFFTQGRITVVDENDEGLFGLMDKDGKMVLPCSYHFISHQFFNGFVTAKKTNDSEYVILNLDGKEATEEELEPYVVPKEISSKFYSVGYLSEGLASFQKTQGGKYGFIDRQGNVVVEPCFDSALTIFWWGVCGCFENGLCAVEKDKKFGLIDRQGKVVLPIEYDGVGLPVNGLIMKRKLFQGDYCAVRKNGKWGFVNRRGEIVVKPQYTDVSNYNDEMAIVGKPTIGAILRDDYTNGVIRIKDNSELLPFRYSQILWHLR